MVWMNEIVSNISNVKYSEIPVGWIWGVLFEDVICVSMKVVYLIICHWTTSNFDVVQWHNIIPISLIPMNLSH